VWFLAGVLNVSGTATRTCSIPAGKVLFFPVINMVDINAPNLSGVNQTAKELRAEIAPCLDAVTTLSVEVDGEPIEKLQGKPEKFRVKSVVFEVTLPGDNVFGIPGGTYSPAVDDGFYVALKPLDVGPHTLRIIGATQGCPISPPFSLDVTYNLTVVPVELD
jgi:hypothetical protein